MGPGRGGVLRALVVADGEANPLRAPTTKGEKNLLPAFVGEEGGGRETIERRGEGPITLPVIEAKKKAPQFARHGRRARAHRGERRDLRPEKGIEKGLWEEMGSGRKRVGEALLKCP